MGAPETILDILLTCFRINEADDVISSTASIIAACKRINSN